MNNIKWHCSFSFASENCFFALNQNQKYCKQKHKIYLLFNLKITLKNKYAILDPPSSHIYSIHSFTNTVTEHIFMQSLYLRTATWHKSFAANLASLEFGPKLLQWKLGAYLMHHYHTAGYKVKGFQYKFDFH